jgi:transmembrane 9 superfamily protein 3
MVGELTSTEGDEDGASEPLLFTEKTFSISYNGPRVIQVNLTCGKPIPLRVGAQLEFTYSVEWHETGTPFHKRFDRYLDYDFFEHQIHWVRVRRSYRNC